MESKYTLCRAAYLKYSILRTIMPQRDKDALEDLPKLLNPVLSADRDPSAKPLHFFYPLYSKAEAHIQVCVSALHAPSRPVTRRAEARAEGSSNAQFSQCATITGMPLLNNFVVAHCENEGRKLSKWPSA